MNGKKEKSFYPKYYIVISIISHFNFTQKRGQHLAMIKPILQIRHKLNLKVNVI